MTPNFLDSIAEQLLNFLRMRFENLEIRDAEGKPIGEDPTQARFFVFDFSRPGTRVLISINGNTLRVIYGSALGKNPDDAERKKWFDFLRSLRTFVSRTPPPQLLFKPQDLSRSKFSVKKEMSKLMSVQDRDTISEGMRFGPMGGRSRSSQQRLGPVRIIIRHSAPVDESVRGSRTRRIERIYVENAQGERRIMPINNLAGARAMARHLAQGGDYDDNIGAAIVEMVSEMSDLRRFVRETRHQQFEDATTRDMVEASMSRYHDIKETLARMRGSRGYERFLQEYAPAEVDSTDINTTELRERFTKKIFPEGLEAVLPRVYRAYQIQQQKMQESVSPDRARELARRRLAHGFLTARNYTNTPALVARVLEELAESVGDTADPMSEFAARWADRLRKSDERVDETLQEEYGLALQLARGYIHGLQEAQDTESQDQIRHLPTSTPPESREFSDWANGLDLDTDADAGDINAKVLGELMSQKLPLGDLGLNAIMMLQAAGINDDALSDDLRELAVDRGQDTDARPWIREWLQENMPETLDSIKEPEVQEAVGGDPVEDFIDSIEDPDILKYGDDTSAEPMELYRRMNGLI
jgi:hypothetical protein